MSLVELAKQLDPQDENEREEFLRAVLEATAPMGVMGSELVDVIVECLSLMELAAISGADQKPHRDNLLAAINQIRPTLH